MFKNKRWIYAVLIAVAAAAFAVIKYGGWPVRGGGHGAAHRPVYYCPMHPQITSDRPGTCPICNMTLVPRDEESPATPSDTEAKQALREFTMKEFLALKPHEICLLHKCKMGNCMITMTEKIARLGKCPHCGEDFGALIKERAPSGHAKVNLSPEKQQVIGVKTSAAVEKPLSKTIRTVGRIAYDPELYQAEEEYLQAVRASEKARTGTAEEIKQESERLVDSSRMKLRLLGLSDELIGELERSGKADRSLLLSEAGGNVWLYAPIYEYEIPLVHPGQSLEVEVPVLSGKKMTGTIRSVDSVVDPTTRSVRVRAVLGNAGQVLKPQMYVNVTITLDLGPTLTVPAEAVFSTGEKNIVFVVRENNFFEPREVVLGVKSEGDYEIKSGVGAGELVVTSGNFLIDSESQLKAALDGMGRSSEGHSHG